MTTNEYLHLTALLGGILLVISAAVSIIGSGKIGWKLILVELLVIGMIGGTIYYFRDPHPDKVIKKRFKEKVLKAHQGCFNDCFQQCTNSCISKRVQEDGTLWLPEVPRKSDR